MHTRTLAVAIPGVQSCAHYLTCIPVKVIYITIVV